MTAGAFGVTACGAESAQRDTIPANELAELPPIAFTWAAPDERAGVGDLYVANADGSGLRRVMGWPRARFRDGRGYGADRVAWSPDRRQIAFEMWGWIGDPATRMAIVSPDGEQLRVLDAWDWGRRSFAWSHDGATLLFSRFHELVTFRAATGHTKRIWSSQKVDTFEGVDWAPGDREVVVASLERGLVRMTPSGTGLRWLTTPADFEADLTPLWSPRGDTVLFSRSGVIRTVRHDGLDLGQLNRNALGQRPLWSPDGRSIVFTRLGRDADPRDVLVMRSDGRQLRVLKTGAAAGAIDWSPDGSKILFRREARDPAKPGQTWWELWVMDANGRRATRLPFNKVGWTVMAADWRS